MVAVPRKTPPANWVPRTRRPLLHFTKHGEIPAKNVAKNTMIRQYTLVRIRSSDLKVGSEGAGYGDGDGEE